MLHLETQNTILKTGLTPQQTHEMRLWLLSKGKKGKSHTSVLYSWYDPDNLKRNGHNAFLAFSQTSLYSTHIGENEQKLIDTYKERIHKKIPKRSKQLIELGPGNDKMTKYMSQMFSYDQKDHIVYRPADMAKSALDGGFADAEHVGFKKGAAILGDRNDPVTFSTVEDAFYVCFGGGFVNGYDQLPGRLSHMQGSGYVQRGRLFATFFGMPGDEHMSNEQKIDLLKAIYGDLGTENNNNSFAEIDSYEKAKDMVLQPFAALGFDTSKLDLGVEREEGDPHKIVLGARVTASFVEKEGDEMYTYTPGDFIPLIDSPRPTIAQYSQQVEAGGGKMHDVFTQDGVVGTLIDLPRKEVPQRMKKTALYGTLILSLLIAGMKIGAYVEIQKKKDREQEVFEETFFHDYEPDGNFLGILHFHTQEAKKVVYALEHRFGNTLTEEQSILVQSIFYDWIKIHPQYVHNGLHNIGGQLYSSKLYTPTLVTRFVREHKNTLISLGIKTMPNAQFLNYQEALKNTYFYDGPQITFDKVDEEIGIHTSEVVSVNQDGDFDHFNHPAGLVFFQGMPYIVFKFNENDKYILEKKDDLLRDYGLEVSSYAIDILQQGEVPLLAERTAQYLNTEYGLGDIYHVNGQQVIAKYFTDLYAQGYNFSYLLTEQIKEDVWSNSGSMLGSFVAGMLLPDIGEQLMSGQEAMHDLDKKKLEQQMEKYAVVKETWNNMLDYTERYLGDECSMSGSASSCLLKLILADRAREFIEDDRDRRCWLTEKRDELEDVGIIIPQFPTFLENYISSGQYSSDDHLENVQTKSATINGGSFMANSYLTISGDRIQRGSYAPVLSLQYKLVGRKITSASIQQIWQDYLAGKYGKFYRNSGRGAGGEITEKGQVITKIIDEHMPLGSNAIHEMMADYHTRKTKQKMYETKKRNGGTRKAQITVISPK